MRSSVSAFSFVLSTLIIAPAYPYLTLKDECTKLLWLSGLQLSDEQGAAAHYITNSSAYVEAYLVALQTAVKHAHSIVPVLAVQGPIPATLQATIEGLGGHVVAHRLSFLDALRRHKPTIASGLEGSYLRIDVAAIVDTVRRTLPGLVGRVDMDYVLWTDPDVLFYHDIDSCTLPKPRYLSIGPDALHGNADNAGVVFFNVTGFGHVHGDMVHWADTEKSFDFFVADQDMIKGYFARREGRSMLQQLPDTFNWKPYWYVILLLLGGLHHVRTPGVSLTSTRPCTGQLPPPL